MQIRRKIRVIALLLLAAVLFAIPVLTKEKMEEPAETELLSDYSVTMDTTEERENTNCLVSVSPEYADSLMNTKDGQRIPDIMSERIMKSDYRKLTISRNGEETEKYISGPKIVINGTPVPADSFYAEGDYWNDEFYYVICPECFKNCGFEPNYGIVLTPYDEACLTGNHTYTVLCDELEIHTTWVPERYDESRNTYYFTVEQSGPFSGISDVFSVYAKGERMNTVPVEGTIHGTALANYDPENRYWETLDYNRDDFRYLIDSQYGTKIGRLPYKRDVYY